MLEEVKALRAEGKDQQQEMKDSNDKVTQQGKDLDDMHKCNSNLIKAVELHQQIIKRIDNKKGLDGAVIDEKNVIKYLKKLI